MNDTASLRAAYDRVAPAYGRKRNRRYDAFRDAVLDWFATNASAVSSDVVDLGSGPGHESLYLLNKGLSPLAVDFSPSMVRQCTALGVRAEVMDFTRLSLPGRSFGGALMSFSLLHLRSAAAREVVADVVDLLLPGGILLILVFEGDAEGYRAEDEARFGTARWFTYYTPEKLRGVLPDCLEVTREWRLDISPRPTIGIAARRAPGEAYHDE
jgi:SAM-dependent methyltransferase